MGRLLRLEMCRQEDSRSGLWSCPNSFDILILYEWSQRALGCCEPQWVVLLYSDLPCTRKLATLVACV